MNASRRDVLAGFTAAFIGHLGTSSATTAAESIRIGVLGIMTGPLAAFGIPMVQGLTLYLKNRGNNLAGHTVETIVYDTQGQRDLAVQKAQRLIEVDKVNIILGPVTSPEALAVGSYLRNKIPAIVLGTADDLTQRGQNPWYFRISATSSQCVNALGDFAAKTQRYTRVISIADDKPFGYELSGGFQRVFEDAGGRITQKIWAPPQATDFISIFEKLEPQIDAIFVGVAGRRGLTLISQARKFGIRAPFLTSFSTTDLPAINAVDDSFLREIAEDIAGTISATWYLVDLETPANAAFVSSMRQEYGLEPTLNAAAAYTSGAVLENVLGDFKGNISDSSALVEMLKKVRVPDTVRGPVSFDPYGNAVGNVYIAQILSRSSRITNALVKTYPAVSQFWTYNPEMFLKNPIYSREYPPANYLEK
jgi:branched-chain amino acid transport system substrate-binding protein